MSDILHILNGDSTLNGFNQTGIQGDVMVWREVLSEGPVQTDIVDAEFWNRRSEWITQTFQEQPEQYQEKVIDELARLDSSYKEINLWFEFDLHCQVNLLGALNYIEERGDLSEPALYLICPDHYSGIENFMGMGQLKGEQLTELFDNTRVQLNEVDLYIASRAWKLYTDNNGEGLKQFIAETEYWASMIHLKPALEAHLKRLQINEQGLNYIEQKLLDIYCDGSTSKIAIYQAFWKTEKIYGMGDAQIDIYLRSLMDKKLIGNL